MKESKEGRKEGRKAGSKEGRKEGRKKEREKERRRARRSQEEQEGARRSQGEPGRARKSQKRPGAARSRRGEEEPVAVLRTHTCCSADATHCNAWSSKTAEQTRASEAGFSQHTRVKLKDGGSICHPASMFPVSQSQIAAGQRLGALSASPTASSQLQWGNCEH